MEEMEGRSALLWTSGEDRPDSLAPTLTCLATCALRDQAVDDDETYRLLGEIVGRLDARRRDETNVAFAMLFEAISKVVRLGRSWNAVNGGGPQQSIPAAVLSRPSQQGAGQGRDRSRAGQACLRK